jgi:hypothetical protein
MIDCSSTHFLASPIFMLDAVATTGFRIALFGLPGKHEMIVSLISRGRLAP